MMSAVDGKFRRSLIVFWSFIRITSLVIGGGYAIISAAQLEFVEKRKWLTDDDVLEMITITQTVPGILACNAAIYIGWRLAGLPGAVAGLLGAVIPSVVIITLIAAGMKSIEHLLQASFVQGMFKGVIGSIVGMVIVTAVKMRPKAVKGVFGWCIALGAFLAMTVFGVRPSWIILTAIAAGIIAVSVERKFAKGAGK
ncbi:MAG: chromate transporter [Lentisphaeria bacterium]|nr:chromate transporter [Lentisphaeria bacterium]MBQ8754368.1 chromate transporter [Lentisphaeria bacterium]